MPQRPTSQPPRQLTPELAGEMVREIWRAAREGQSISGRSLAADFVELVDRSGGSIGKTTAQEWADEYYRGTEHGSLGKPPTPPIYRDIDTQLVYRAAFDVGVASVDEPPPPEVQAQLDRIEREIDRSSLWLGVIYIGVGLVGIVVTLVAFQWGWIAIGAALTSIGWTAYGFWVVAESLWRLRPKRRRPTDKHGSRQDGSTNAED